MNNEFAQSFAQQWLSAWNSHDLTRILNLYRDDFVMSSPLIIALGFDPSGTLQGKTAIGAYWQKALAMLPDLHFELITTLRGADSLILYYRGHRGFSAEIFYFDSEQKVTRSAAHYAVEISAQTQ